MNEDPYFGEIPWDIIQDDSGQVVGEVFRIRQEESTEELLRKERLIKKSS